MDALKEYRRSFYKGITFGFGFLAVLILALAAALTAATITGTMNTFTEGQVVSASQINENFTTLKTSLEAVNTTPVGSIVAWHKNFNGTATIPAGWVECNGQTISDSASTFNGLSVPDLNGQARFLRGSATSGTLQADAFQGHSHLINRDTGEVGSIGYSNTGGADGGIVHRGATGTSVPGVGFFIGDVRTYGAYGTPRAATETRSINMSVVWIMKIK